MVSVYVDIEMVLFTHCDWCVGFVVVCGTDVFIQTANRAIEI